MVLREAVSRGCVRGSKSPSQIVFLNIKGELCIFQRRKPSLLYLLANIRHATPFHLSFSPSSNIRQLYLAPSIPFFYSLLVPHPHLPPTISLLSTPLFNPLSFHPFTPPSSTVPLYTSCGQNSFDILLEIKYFNFAH